MKKWEYRIIDTNEVSGGGGIFKGKSPKEVEAYLNELGEQGWEIVNFDAFRQQRAAQEDQQIPGSVKGRESLPTQASQIPVSHVPEDLTR